MDKLKKISIELPKFNLIKDLRESRAKRNSNKSSSSVSSLTISEPTDFKHNISVKYDEVNNKFTGLPDQWQALLKENDIKLNFLII